LLHAHEQLGKVLFLVIPSNPSKYGTVLVVVPAINTGAEIDDIVPPPFVQVITA
jgi:hypothetical protein